jgi:hypothetical protein
MDEIAKLKSDPIEWERIKKDPAELLNLVDTLYENVGAYHREAFVQETWVEVPVADDWIVAYRLVPQRGVPTIAELRVFPRQPRSADSPGGWDGEWRNFDVAVPRGGVTARLLRRVKVGDHLRFGNEALAWFQKEARRAPYGIGVAFGVDVFDQPKGRREAKAKHHAGGRPKHPDAFYAEVAERYASVFREGQRKPVEATAAAMKQPVPNVRSMIHEARERGLLTRVSQGKAGGALTPLARKLLRDLRRKKKSQRKRR